MTVALYESPRSAVMLDHEGNALGLVAVLGVMAGAITGATVQPPSVVVLIVAREDDGHTSGPWFYLAPQFVRMTVQPAP